MRTITVTRSVTLDGVVQGLSRPDEDTRGSYADAPTRLIIVRWARLPSC